MCLKIASYSLLRHLGLCKNKDFQFEVSLEMPPSSPSIKDFGIDIRNLSGIDFNYTVTGFILFWLSEFTLTKTDLTQIKSIKNPV